MSIKAINARNQFHGQVKRIKRGDVVSEVEVDTGHGIITSIVTTSSIDTLDLKPGSEVVALFKSTEVALATFSPLE
ncbi:MAG: TOBE domain-containing protein [Porticoccaceae bacterium]|jgi:molybdopterin-binding protein|nr:TOBE domain-containing protein [Porticoccaceae bacterium]MEA3301064.1 TOBE domain-containing protein [Pseudomonadota bacterium]HLS99767.1 TOBE domain-containing protein [Porticoccaceae bacterium]